MKKMYVQHIIDYVEDHIEETISLDTIEAYMGYSKNYLHKLFYIYTGLYIMAYTRKRKLEYSIQDLKTDKSILDIALTYGYGSERSYARSFRNVYGVSPGNYRHNTCVLTPKLELTHIGGIKMLPYLTEAQLVTLVERHALGHQIISKEPEGDVIDYMTNFRIDNKIPVFTEIGFDVPVTTEQLDQGYRGYEQWIIIDKAMAKTYENDTVKHKVVPKGKYLMLTIKDPFADPFERIVNGWKKLVAQAEIDYKGKEASEGCDFFGFEEKIDMMYRTDMNLYLKVSD